jgi:hypothetical protein
MAKQGVETTHEMMYRLTTEALRSRAQEQRKAEKERAQTAKESKKDWNNATKAEVDAELRRIGVHGY